MTSKEKLISVIRHNGFPEELGIMIADTLKTERAIDRMIAYILQFKPTKAEDIADEMLAIQADNENWKNKKTTEFYNKKYNEWLNTEER